MMTDPIADMLTRIRNALSAGKLDVNMPDSKQKRRYSPSRPRHFNSGGKMLNSLDETAEVASEARETNEVLNMLLPAGWSVLLPTWTVPGKA